MRSVTRIAAMAAGLVVSSIFTSAASAADYNWSILSGGTQQWGTASNWSPNGVPNAAGDLANLNVDLTANLNVGLAADYTIGTLQLGGTLGAVTTDVGNANASGKGLIFNNSPAGNNAFIYSRGAVGSTNIISAPIYLSGGETTFTTLQIGNTDTTLDPVEGQRSLIVNGPVQSLSFDRQITNNLRNGATVTYNGDFVLSGGIDTVNVGTVGRRIIINGSLGTRTIINGHFVAGPLPTASISGGSGAISMGGTQAPPSNIPLAEISTPIYEMNADNSSFGGAIVINRGRFILNAPNALGTGEFRYGNPSNEYGYELVAGTADYHLPNLIRFAQSMTARGENSLTFDGVVYQSASRIHTNLLPEGKTLTYANKVFAANTTGDTRNFYIEGPGTTVFSGGLHNVYDSANPLSSPLLNNQGNGGSFIKRGTGTAIVTSTASTMRGVVYSHGGLLEFATDGSYGVQADNGEGSPNAGAAFMLTNPGGAIGVRTGSINTDFLTLFTNDQPGFSTFNDSLGNQVASRGSIALSSADAAVNIDFTTHPQLSHDRLRNVSIGALSSGVTYTGTITPDSNTYRLGGGGTLTLPNANQLTGARNLEVRNGGTVVLGAANNYSGTTTIQGNWIATTEEYARAGTDNILQTYTDANNVDQAERIAKGIYMAPTLEVKSASALGSSSGNVVVRGGVLKYSGAANETTNRNLTIGAVGATLDSSGAGTITFANTGAATLEDQADITSDVAAPTNALTTGNGGSINFGNNDPLKVANVGLGWTVTGPGIPVTATVDSISMASSQQTTASGLVVWLRRDTSDALSNGIGGSTYSFTNQHRTLTLTGSNAGSNTVAAALGDSAKGKLSINKTGTGTWVLSGNNTYTGATTVTAGTLGVGSANALAGTSGTTVKSGATLAIAAPSASAVQIDNAKLTRESGSKLDLLRGKLVLEYSGASPLAAVKADIISGYAAGAHNGPGILTSDTVGGRKLRVGYAEASQIAGTTWFGQTEDGTAILLAGTFAGDTDLNGTVNFDDLLKLAQNYNGTGKEWVDGDSDYNGTVDFDDLLSLAQSYSAVLSTAETGLLGESFASDYAMALSLVPEPVSLSGLAALGLLAGRRRRD